MTLMATDSNGDCESRANPDKNGACDGDAKKQSKRSEIGLFKADVQCGATAVTDAYPVHAQTPIRVR